MGLDKIKLVTKVKKELSVNMLPTPAPTSIDDIDITKCKGVYSDSEYDIRIENSDTIDGEIVDIFVNDEKISFSNRGGTIEFTEKKIFLNRFGFVELSIVINKIDGTQCVYYSELLSVLIKRTETSIEIDEMLKYIYRKKEKLLISGHVSTRALGDFKRGASIDLTAKISLAQEIHKLYKENFGYFKANSRFKTETINAVDDAKKLQHISPNTLQFIATHPGLLNKNESNNGIRVGTKSYIPEKTLVEKKVYSVNIWENQVIVGFIRKMIVDITQIIQDVSLLLERKNVIFDAESEYVHSTYFIFRDVLEALKSNQLKLKLLQNEFEKLLNLYSKALNVENIEITRMPKPTSIFLSVPQYNCIYTIMHKWFEYGIYSLESERFMMSFLSVSDLYEVYILAKVIESISGAGFEETSQERFKYKMARNAKYNNTMCDNTFRFERGMEKIVLYYQPVIYDGKTYPQNNIDLYRNNSYSVKNDKDEGQRFGTCYYTPDYLIKYWKNDNTSYSIIDAKYSSVASVRNNIVKELAFKYIISISTREDEKLEGLYIIYGKAKEEDTIESVYNKLPLGTVLTPRYECIPITASVNKDLHGRYINRILTEEYQ